MAPDRIEHAKRLCRRWVEQGVHKALCVLVARRGVVCLHEAYGRLGPGGAPLLERDSIFPMLSITKSVTATAVMQLVDDGIIGLTRPVNEYIPEFRGAGKQEVCVHHLLTHTSGIGGGRGEPEEETADLPDSDIDQWTLNICRTRLAYEPGSEMRYTGANFVLLGEIIRRSTGRTVADHADERIFAPLGMRDSSFVLPPEHEARTISWNAMVGLGDTTTSEFRAQPAPNIGMHSTAMDIATFGQMFLNGGSYGDARLLHPHTVAEMTRDQIPGVGATLSVGPLYEKRRAEASWSYGWSIAGNATWSRWPKFPLGTFTHSGGGGALLWMDPTNDIVGVYLSICRFSPETGDPLTNNDLFVNAIVASVQ